MSQVTLRRRAKIGVAVAILALPVVALAGVWAFLALIGGDAAPTFELSQPQAGEEHQPGDPGGTAVQGSTATQVDGTWVVVGDGSSEAGYRIDEDVPLLPDPNTVVGRTSAVEGSMTISESGVTAVDVTADLSKLDSGDQRRENSLADRYLDFNTYPTAQFTLTEPIVLEEIPAAGEQFTTTAIGDLTLHGVTREVSVDTDAQLLGEEQIEVVGGSDIILADFDIERPDIAGIVTVKEAGTLEFRLVFERT